MNEPLSGVDWQRVVNATADSPADALNALLDLADDIENVVIVAAFKSDAERAELRNGIVARCNSVKSYIRLGLLYEGVAMANAMVGRATTDDTAE